MRRPRPDRCRLRSVYQNLRLGTGRHLVCLTIQPAGCCAPLTMRSAQFQFVPSSACAMRKSRTRALAPRSSLQQVRRVTLQDGQRLLISILLSTSLSCLQRWSYCSRTSATAAPPGVLVDGAPDSHRYCAIERARLGRRLALEARQSRMSCWHWCSFQLCCVS